MYEIEKSACELSKLVYFEQIHATELIISGVGVGVQQTVQGRPSSNHCVTMCMKPVHAESIFAILWQNPVHV